VSYFYLPHFFQEKNQNICYVEKKYDVSAIPRWIQEIQAKYLIDGTVLLNDLPKNHINRADSQLIIESYAYENKIKLTVNSKLSDFNNWNQLIRISSSCSEMETISQLRRLSEADIKLQFVQKEEFPSKQEGLAACIEQYNLLEEY
jgi:glycine betaine/choline ABC-type transport system substrate-binding protein